jgi:hypothetical protein
MNDVWTEDQSQMSPETVKAILMIWSNLDMSSTDFYQKTKDDHKLLQCVHTSKKYNWCQADKFTEQQQVAAGAKSSAIINNWYHIQKILTVFS